MSTNGHGTGDGAETSWRLRIQHRTGFTYGSEVQASYNEARLTPCAERGQFLISSRIEVRPAARLTSYVDYWDTVVHAFDVHSPHSQLEVTATSLVDTVPAQARTADITWGALADPVVRDRWCEYLGPSGPVTINEDLLDPIGLVRSAATPTDAVAVAVGLVSDRLSYVSGSTDVFTTDAEAWRAEQGVCQDYSHLTIALLRGAGIPARYSSGYLHPGEGEVGTTVVGQSHAWVEAWVGRWEAHDPTNRRPVGQRHVLVATGRDYTDVPPLKGIFSGGPSVGHQVSVELTRLAR
jgi:transglutaminase-like putative cysteine protease